MRRPSGTSSASTSRYMWKPYRDAATALLPDARVVVDKFHVVKMANKCLDDTRKRLRAGLTATDRRKPTQKRRRKVVSDFHHSIPNSQKIQIEIEGENDAEFNTVGVSPRLGEPARPARGIPGPRSAGPTICPAGVLAV